MPVIDASSKFVGVVKCVQQSERLLRVTGAGLMDNDCHVHAEQIARADEEQVLLSVRATDLNIEYGSWI